MHIDKDRREACLNVANVTEAGELHYYFGQQMQRDFIKEPRYHTLSKLRGFFVQTAREQKYFKQIRKIFNVPLDVILNEAAMAWEFFAIEVGEKYEQVKAAQNGHAYEESLKLIAEMMAKAEAEKAAPVEVKQ